MNSIENKLFITAQMTLEEKTIATSSIPEKAWGWRKINGRHQPGPFNALDSQETRLRTGARGEIHKEFEGD